MGLALPGEFPGLDDIGIIPGKIRGIDGSKLRERADMQRRDHLLQEKIIPKLGYLTLEQLREVHGLVDNFANLNRSSDA